MDLAPDTTQIAKYSPTSTPILDVLRPLPPRKRGKLSAGEYFFLSGAIILILIGLPEFRRITGSIAVLGIWPAAALTCLIIPGAALLLSLATHEGGHFLAAWLSGFRLTQEKMHSVFARSQDNEQRFYFCDMLRIGTMMLEPRKLDQLRYRLCFLVMGGPLASLLLPLLLEIYVSLTLTRVIGAFLVHVFSAVSVLLGIAELLPDTGKGNSSDGARILMLLRNDSAAQRWLSIIQLQLVLNRGEHPRTWDEGLVARATALQDDSRDAVAARWLGYIWAAERQDITTATKYLEEALAAPEAASAWLRDRLFLEAAEFQAWFRDDSGKAQFWVERIRSRKLAPLQRLRLEVALVWAEGKLFDAWEKLGVYIATLDGMPDSPARDLSKKSAREWKAQMESRMLTRAWRAMYSITQQVDLSTPATASPSAERPKISSW